VTLRAAKWPVAVIFLRTVKSNKSFTNMALDYYYERSMGTSWLFDLSATNASVH
jgi:hypothetical protein